MVGTILVREALRRACYLLGDLSPVQFQRHRETELVDFLNDGALAIVSYMPTAGAMLATVKLKPGALQSIESIPAAHVKLPDGSAPTAAVRGINFLHGTRNRGATGLVNGRALRVVDRRMLEATDPDWQADSRAKTDISAYMFDPVLPKHFWVVPPAHATTEVWMEIALNAEPIKVPNSGEPGAELYREDGSSQAVIPLPDVYLDDLVNYIVARANMNASEWADADKALYFTGLFTASLNAKVAAATGVNPNLRRLPFAAEPTAVAA